MTKDNNTAKVMLFGTFHFSNPSLDEVKIKAKNVMDSESQSYLEDLCQKIATFRPTEILLEYDPKKDQEINDKYTEYLKGTYSLKTDEIEQLGFRIAKFSELDRLHSFDVRDVPLKAEPLFEQFKNEPQLGKMFNKMIREMEESENKNHSTLSLKELLKLYNSLEMDLKNKSFYMATNVAGVDQNFSGAELSSSWWHRNFRMYAKIQNFAKAGERLLVIGGQGHTAILRDLVSFDSNITNEDINSYL